MPVIGAIAIGRNEGERIGRCLRSLQRDAIHLVYVDSGSTDESLAIAGDLGADVVELDPGPGFSAGRARNRGFAHLLEQHPDVELVQFVDGDCEVCDGWLDAAVDAFRDRDDVAIVCGRLRERHPEQSVYNRLCDIEWSGEPGEVTACGGIFMVRAAVFKSAGGFDPDIIAGEEPDLCLRLRREGLKILRLADDMAWHDAAMTRFSQWWTRAVRAGYSYAHGMAKHGASPDRYRVRMSMSIWFWGGGLPVTIAAISILVCPWAWFLFGVYPLQSVRVGLHARWLADRRGDRWLYGLFVTLSKFPQFWGQVKFWWRRLWNRKDVIIEYKGASR